MVISLALFESHPTLPTEAGANLSPPVTSNKNQAHPFLLLSQETERQKGQHGHRFQIYVIG